MKRSIILLSIAALSLLGTAACQTNKDRDLNYAISLLNTKPDSCLFILETIKNEDLTGARNKARHSLYLSAALDKNYIDIASDSIIRYAVRYYSQRGLLTEQMLTWYYYGLILNNKHDYPSAVVAFEKAGYLADKLNDAHYSGLICRNIAHSFYESNNIPSSIEYSKKSVSFFSRDMADSVYLNYGYYSLAVQYLTNKDYYQADSVLNLISGSSAERLKHYIHSSKAAIELFYKDNPKQALTYYQSIPRNNLYYLDYTYFATALEKLEMKDSADYMINQAYYYCVDQADSATVDYIESKILFGRNQLEDAYRLIDNATTVQDSLTRLLLIESVSSAQREYYKYEAERQEEKTKRTITQSVVLLSVILLFSIIIYLIILSHNKEKDQRLKELMAQLAVNDEIIFDLSKSNASLISTHFSERIRQLDQLSKDYYSADTDTQRELVFRQFKEYINDLNDDESFYKTLENDLNKYCNGVIRKLKEQIPEIKGRHLHLISLFFASLSYKTISLITRAQSIRSLKTQRSRYRRIIEESNAKDASFFLEMLEVKTPAGKKKNEKQS